MAPQSNRVEFRTVDGVTLRGDYFPVAQSEAPIIIMSQGLTLLKEHYIPSWGHRFHDAGYAVLIYDHRGWGSSDGLPRNAVNPYQQAEDYHDAVLFARSLEGIDRNRVALWGIGHSGGASMIAAGDDPYVKAVILVMPFTSGKLDSSFWPEGLLEKTFKERELRTRDPGTTLKYAQVWDNSDEEALGERGMIPLHGHSAYEFISGAEKLSKTAGTPWENRMTLQSFYDIARCEPRDHIYKISPRPLLFLAASVDPISGPIEKLREAYDMAREPKQFVELEGHHIGNYFEGFESNVKVQIDFLKAHL